MQVVFNATIISMILAFGSNFAQADTPAKDSNEEPTDRLSLDEFFASSDLTEEELVLKEVIFHSSAHDPVWRVPFVAPPRIIGFVADDQYCQKYTPVLKNNLNHRNPKVRYAVAERLAELKNADGFEVLLDALKAEEDRNARGGDKWLFEFPGIADRLIAMIGHPDGYDPHGATALRDAVIENWRRRWHREGDSWLRGLSKAREYSPVTGLQTLELRGKTVATKRMPDMEEFFFLSSSKLFEFASMDGRFPPGGLLSGDDTGIWAHPVKAMDGFEFTIKEDGHAPWKLLDCREYVQKLHSCEFIFNRNDLSITRTDFAVEEEPALFTVLTISNNTDHPRTVDVEFSGRVNIRPAWLSGWSNDLDVVSYDSDNHLIGSYDNTHTNWATVFGSDRTPSEAKLVDNMGVLTYSIDIAPSESKEIAFLVVAEHDSGLTAAKQRFNTLVSQRTALQEVREERYRQQLFNEVVFTCSDANVTNAFVCAKANIMMMTLDARPHHVGPYFYGGIPDYTQLFSCDTAYAIAGAVAGGFREEAKGNLQCLAKYAQLQSGRVPHQVSTNGKVLSPGNAQETQQFVVACGKYVDWTGDQQFVVDYYDQLKQCIDWVLASLDSDGDHYPEGYSIMEILGVNGENIDSACYLYKAFDVLAKMADHLGYAADASTYASYAGKLKTSFNTDFWNSSQKMWADSIEGTTRHMRGLWGVNIPQEIAIADPPKALIVLGDRQSRGTDQYCPYTNGIVVLGAYHYGDAEQGWTRLKWSAEAPMKYGMLGGFENVTISPDDVPLIESPSLFIQGILEGLCGISPSAVEHKLQIFPQPPEELDDLRVNNFHVGSHQLDMSWRREPDGDQQITVLHEAGPEAIEVTVMIKPHVGKVISLDGTAINPRQETLRGIATRSIPVTLNPGQKMVVRIDSARD